MSPQSWLKRIAGAGSGCQATEMLVAARLAPWAKKRALAWMRLSGAPVQTNLQRGAGAVPYSQRLCPRGCTAAVDTEQHVYLSA
jgi:hypothetical protein